jgi:NAD(P)-dependent dehydrogenase (short-subunit alcohol dehydrogenase family)
MKIPFKVNLEGKVAVVTGGSGVLCSAIGEALAECGAKVALVARNLEKTEKLAKEMTNKGLIVKAYAADVLDRDALEEFNKKIKTDLGSCDILVNGAGGNSPKATTDDEEFDKTKEGIKTFFDLEPSGVEFVLHLNYLGTLLPTQVFAKDMVNKEGCCILNISSMNAFTPLTKIPAYSAAKAGVSNFTQWMATYFAKAGIRCNAIAPGFFATEQNKTLLFNEDGSSTPRTEKILKGTPMDRFGEPEELIGTALLLCDSKSSSFITGAVIPIDGGFAAYSGV